MKRLRYLYMGALLFFFILFVLVNVLQKQREETSHKGRNIVMNRIANLVEVNMAEREAEPEAIIRDIFYKKIDDWQQEYGESILPVSITYLPTNREISGVNNMTDTTGSQSVWVLYEEKEIAGLYSLL